MSYSTMKTIIVCFLSGLVFAQAQRRFTDSPDELNVFGVSSGSGRRITPNPDDSSWDTFSVTDRSRGSGSNSGSDFRRSGGSFTNGGRFGGNANSGSSFDRNNGDDSSSFGSGDRDTGFDRLTTQDDRFARRTTARGDSSFDRRNGDDSGSFGSGSGDRDSGFDRLTTQNDRFARRTTPSSSDRDFDRDFSSGGSFSGSGSSGSRLRAVDNYRIEVQVQRLEDKGSIAASGSSCDFLSQCDPKLSAIIDTESPMSAWPGTIPVAKWPVIFTANNVDSPTINKVVSRDVCSGRSIDTANLRVYVVDVDSISTSDEMNKFQCIFPITPSFIASDSTTAQWGDTMECKATSQVGKIKLFVRQRAYQISSSNCNSGKL